MRYDHSDPDKYLKSLRRLISSIHMLPSVVKNPDPRKLLTTFGHSANASVTRIRKKTLLEWYVLADHVYNSVRIS